MSLKARLEDTAVYSPYDRTKKFIPEYILNDPKIFNESLVESELSAISEQSALAYSVNLNHLAKVIVHGDLNHPDSSFRKIFATLILLGKGARISEFIEAGVDDSCLPILLPSDCGVADNLDHNSNNPFHEHENTLLHFFRSWSIEDFETFLKTQWTFLSPVFKSTSTNVPHYTLTPHHILAITADLGPVPSGISKDDEASTQELTGTTKVTRIKLHPRHYSFDLGSNAILGNIFVLKTIPKVDNARFEQEARALRSAALLRDEQHVIQLLVTFEIPSDGYYLLFPCADGDLEFLWRTRPDLRQRRDSILWMARECANIAQALAKIHDQGWNAPTDDRVSIHGDMCSKNLLWFSRGDTDRVSESRLVIADFGHAKIDRPRRLKDEELDLGSWTYRAPESAVPGAHITSAIDVWSLGCLLLEFATWHLLGWEAVDHSFTKARLQDDPNDKIPIDTFFTLRGHGQVEVKPAVWNWVDCLTSLDSCSAFFRDFLELVMGHLLCVDVAQRVTAQEVAVMLRDIHHRCQSDPDYCQPIV